MKILFFSCDPGGTNCLIPIYLRLVKECSCVFFSKESSFHLLCEREILAKKIKSKKSIDEEENEIRDIIQMECPNLIVTGTSADDLIERLVWKVARENKTKTICILDAWCSYIVRFSNYTLVSHHVFTKNDITILPNLIIVPDNSAKTDLIKLGIASEKIEVGGHPYLEFVGQCFDQIDFAKIEEYKKSIGARNKKIILYASDNLSQYSENGESPWGFDERTTFDSLIKSILTTCNTYDDYLLIIRPHPKENRDYWFTRIKNTNIPIEIIVDSNSSSEIEIMSSDLVIGSFTMLLNSALVAGKRVLSIQINSRKRESFYAADIGLIYPCYSEEELNNNLKSYFMGLYSNDKKLSFQNNSINNICRIIKRELEEK